MGSLSETPTPAQTLIRDDYTIFEEENVDEDDHALEEDIDNSEIEGYFEEQGQIGI